MEVRAAEAAGACGLGVSGAHGEKATDAVERRSVGHGRRCQIGWLREEDMGEKNKIRG